MGRSELLKQAERAERLADQATDAAIVHTLRDAANDYRHAAETAEPKLADRPGLRMKD